MIPVNLALKLMHQQFEKEMGKPIQSFKLVCNIKDKQIAYVIDGEELVPPAEKTYSLFNAIKLFMDKEQKTLEKDETFKVYNIEGCIITYAVGADPGATLLIAHKINGIKLKIEKKL